MTAFWKRAALSALGLYLVLFAFGFLGEWRKRHALTQAGGFAQMNQQQGDGFAISKKNYASSKIAAPVAAGPSIANSQKYEKIATLTQQSSEFDGDRAKVEAAIAARQGVVQLERGSGLKGHRVLHLGIGVPPDQFDVFIAVVRLIGTTTLVTTVKNDKTNEYLQLRAKRATLEKSRAALDALQGSGGSIDERIHVQSQLAETEEKIQELGVSLGEFDTQNELCTVKLTLEEVRVPSPVRLLPVILAALRWSAFVYAALAAGFLALMTSGWIGLALFRRVQSMVRDKA